MKIINYDIIGGECRGDEVPKDVIVGYQNEKKKLLSRLGRSFRLKILTNKCFYG